MLCAATALGFKVPSRSKLALVAEVIIPTKNGQKKAMALIDSGAQANFVSQHWIKEHLPDVPNPRPRQVRAIDGHEIYSYGQRRLDVQATDRADITREFRHTFNAVEMVGYDIILGYPWLRQTNPDVDWLEETWAYRQHAAVTTITSNELEDELRSSGTAAYMIMPYRPDDDTILLGSAVSPPGAPVDPGKPPLHDLLEEFRDVFDDKRASIIPSHAAYDHAIDVEPGKQPPHRAIYQLSSRELSVLRTYLEQALEKGWIRRSKSPAGAPVLFVPKKMEVYDCVWITGGSMP